MTAPSARPSSFPTDYRTERLIVADLNGDGRLDLVNLNAVNLTATGPGRFLTIHLNTTPASCVFAIAPSSQAFGPAGGGDSVAVTAPAGCAWTAASNDPGVVTVTSGASGGGPGTVGYSVSANSGPARQGRLTIAGQTFTVNQDSGCTFSIAPSSASFPAGGGSDQVTVTTAAGCAWSATSNDPSVVTISTGASGAGGGLVQYLVASNSGPARKGTMTIAGQTFTVNQDSGCTFAFLPTSAHFAPAGGSGSVTVSTAAGCDWTAASQDPSWLTLTSGASGSGSGTVGYSVSANSGPARSSTIRIGAQSFAVSQDGIHRTQHAHRRQRRRVAPRRRDPSLLPGRRDAGRTRPSRLSDPCAAHGTRAGYRRGTRASATSASTSRPPR